ncbi:MAG: hypothetical protein ACLTAX_03895 [Waltera sp.]
MRIQAANTFYTGTYSVLNTKSSFPYAVKVEGYGKTRNQRSLFQFAHVTITEHMVNAKYGTKITNGPRVQMQTAGSKKKEDWTEVSKEQLAEVKLPASFEKLKEQKSYFYHGENISDYELVQTAVALGKMELPTDEKSVSRTELQWMHLKCLSEIRRLQKLMVKYIVFGRWKIYFYKD